MAGTFDLGAMLAEPQLSVEYKKAAEVDAQIKQSAMQAQENLYNMAMGFKKMRDEKLYTALGYANFGDYCEKEIGMSRTNVYNYIKVVEKLPQDFVNSSLQIGVKKLTLLATLDDEQREEITETTDLESTSVRELNEKIKELQSVQKERDELEKLLEEQQGNYSIHTKKREEKIADLEKQIDELKSKSDNSEEITQMKTQNRQLEDKVIKLQNELKEYKDSPIEVVNSADNSEKIASLEMQLEQAQEELKKANENSVSEEYIKYKAALKGAEQSLHQLLVATLNYKSGKSEVQAMIENFSMDFLKCFDN